MHRLSSRWTMLSAYTFLFMMALNVIAMIANPPGTLIVMVIPLVFLVLGLLYLRKVRGLKYDNNSLYVRSILRTEAISLGEISSVNVPDSWFDRVYQVELKSGRIIEFVPEFPSTLFIWESPDVPQKVRRFQMTVRNFERDHGS